MIAEVIIYWQLMAGLTPSVLTNYHATGIYFSKAACQKGAIEWRRMGVKRVECIRVEEKDIERERLCEMVTSNWLPSGQKAERVPVRNNLLRP
jgi:hypothetical protein